MALKPANVVTILTSSVLTLSGFTIYASKRWIESIEAKVAQNEIQLADNKLSLASDHAVIIEVGRRIERIESKVDRIETRIESVINNGRRHELN